MDDRQRQVEAGAGLQESRLNQDFIDLLKKYGTTVLLILLAIMATYVGIQRYNQFQQDKTDQAFADLDGAANTPAILLNVASTWDGRGSVWEIATLRAANAYLVSARSRAEVGIDPSQTSDFEPISDEQVRTNLKEAVRLYTTVLDRTKGSKVLFAQDARWGLATANLGLAALSQGDEREQYLNAAASETEALVGVAEGNDPNKAAIGKARLELIEVLRTSPVSVYETANLPESARFQPDPREAAMSIAPSLPNAQPTTPMDTSGLGQGRPMTPEELQQFMANPSNAGPETGPQPPATGPEGDGGAGKEGSAEGGDDPAQGDGASGDPESGDPASADPPAGNPGQ